MCKLYKAILIAFLLFSTSLFAQYKISGVVTDAATGDKLIGANVYLTGTSWGAATDADGKYSITVDAGSYTITCSYIGYTKIEKDIDVNADMTLNFAMTEYQFTLSLEVISDRAKDRVTPVAFTNVTKKEMEVSLGSRDIPLVLNETPSVYATPGGGGPGDSRINLRGFNQRNIAIMINGVPTNDMENGWLYWSNWDGLGDATSSIQLQRGLSATTLTTPSIGGTMNIITDPTQLKKGVYFKSETGSGNFSKQTLFAHTGLIDKKFALSLGGVRKTATGLVDKAWTDAWAYYLGASYQLNKKNRIELYMIGAPQRHGQRIYALNAAEFSHELARDLGFSETTLKDPRLREQGILYNSNWNGVSSSYSGEQYYEMYLNTTRQDRYDRTYLMERENYYHKPQVNLNWYSQLTDKMTLYTTVYYSGGKGGGTGTWGNIRYNTSLYQRVPDWDATIDNNTTHVQTFDFGDGRGPRDYIISNNIDDDPNEGGIIRNSVNQQWTIGAIAKAYYKFSKKFIGSFGVDWRTAKIEHWREIRDLLGNDYYYSTDNQFDVTEASRMKSLGDKIAYNFTNTVNWIGGYLQGEYTAEKFTAYGTAGWSMISYSLVDHFRKGSGGGELKLEPDAFTGYQFKGGASFRVSGNTDIYANAGYINKVPIVDAVYNDESSELLDNPQNEKFLSFEVGSNVTLLNRRLTLKANVYYTNWTDRTVSNVSYTYEGQEGVVVIKGMDANHMGIEFTAGYQPVREFRLDAVISKGIWEQTNNPQAIQKIYDANINKGFIVYLDGIKVGDAPQFQTSIVGSLFPFDGFQLQAVWNFYDEYYSNWAAETRTDKNDKAQSWKIPSYNTLDLHLSYNLPASVFGTNVNVFAHVFNVLNTLYVADALDNSPFNAYGSYDPSVAHIVPYKPHTAEAAEIYPGLPINFNAGFSIRF